MKYASFVRLGETCFGVLHQGKVFDLTYQLAGGSSSLKEAIHFGTVPDNTEELEGYLGNVTAYDPADITFLPVIPDPGKIFCIGLNYENHRKETERPEVQYPTIFTRFAESQLAHREAIIKPALSDKVDFEGELAVVIGKGGKNISTEEAMKSIAGYTCYNDVSIRDYQRHTSQFVPGKNFSKTGGCGPFLPLESAVKDYQSLTIKTILNGEVMQEARLDQLIFKIPEIVSYISSFTPLVAGDVIVTGTPGGVGDRRDPPVYMKNGDIIEVEISEVGKLVNPVLDENIIL